MITKTILLNSVKKVKDLIKVMGSYEGKATIKSGDYAIKAQSIMGIFSLDITQELELDIEDDEFDIDLSEFEVSPEPEPGPEPDPDPEPPEPDPGE